MIDIYSIALNGFSIYLKKFALEIKLGDLLKAVEPKCGLYWQKKPPKTIQKPFVQILLISKSLFDADKIIVLSTIDFEIIVLLLTCSLHQHLPENLC